MPGRIPRINGLAARWQEHPRRKSGANLVADLRHFLTVILCHVTVKLALQQFGIFGLLRAVMLRCSAESALWTQRATALNGNIAQPFRDSQDGFLHGL
jgi:hypothetical protein